MTMNQMIQMIEERECEGYDFLEEDDLDFLPRDLEAEADDDIEWSC